MKCNESLLETSERMLAMRKMEPLLMTAAGLRLEQAASIKRCLTSDGVIDGTSGACDNRVS